jgi:DNA/RNA-binding protein KIN17
MSPKDIANRIKAKGLTKLQFYCQACSRALRDANAFKCHLTSESHKRQMEIFGQDPHGEIRRYSEEFETTFLEHMKRCHPFSRISANMVYNELIAERHHVHMNSTKWLSLTEFVKYLGKEGKCKVEDTPKGWYITLIQKDPFEEIGEKKRAKRERADREEEERHQRALERQIERARQAAVDNGQGGEEEKDLAAAREVNLEDLDKPLEYLMPSSRLGLGAGGGNNITYSGTAAEAAAAARRTLPSVAFDDGDDAGTLRASGSGMHPPHKKSKLEQLMERDLQAKKQQAVSDAAAAATAAGAAAKPRKGPAPWLVEGIIIKVMSKALKEHGYYKQKGTILRVIDTYIGEIEMLSSGDVVRVDQAELETVIPQPGGAVLIVAGPMKGCKGTLVAIDEKAFAAEINVVIDKKSGGGGGEESKVKLEYEEFSKLA